MRSCYIFLCSFLRVCMHSYKTPLLLLFIFFSFALKSQIYAGGTFSVLNYSGSKQIIIAPELGYNINKKWSIAGTFSYYHLSGANEFAFTPYARFHFFEKNMFSLFIDGGIDMYLSDPKLYWGVGLMPGMSLKITDRLSLVSKYGFLGYRDSPTYSIYGVSFSSVDFKIGFYLNF